MPNDTNSSQPKLLDANGLSIVLTKLKLHLNKALRAVVDGTQDALDEKITKPTTAGLEGQVLTVSSDGGTQWATPGTPSSAQVHASVYAYLDTHPSLPAIVEDGSITKVKLDSDLQNSIDSISTIGSAIENDITPAIQDLEAHGHTSIFTLSLSAESWTQMTQALSFDGGAETDNLITVVPAEANHQEYDNCGVWCDSVGTSNIVFKCLVAPTSNIVVYVIKTRVAS